GEDNGYGDYQIGNVTISWVYYMEGLGHNLFSVGQFCDSDLEVAFRQHTCFIQAVATASFTQNRSIIRLRHRKTPYELLHSKLPDLSFFHMFGALCYPTNDSENFAMAFEQCSSGPALNEMTPGTISLGLVQKSSPSTSYVPPSRNDWDLLFQPMFEELLNPLPSVVNQAPEVIAPIAEVIPPVHVDSIGSPSSTTVDQDAPSMSKSHTPTEIQSSVIPPDVGDDNLYMESDVSEQTMGLSLLIKRCGIIMKRLAYETSVARSLQQNGVVERRNRTLIEAARTIKLPDLSFFHVFGALCYPTNDSENLGKLQPKADIGIFIGYAPTRKAFRIYNRRTKRIIETIHVDFDELTAMASEQCSSGPALNEMTPGTIINANLTGSPSSTMVEQDAPFTSNSTTPTETQSSVIPQDAGDDNLDMEVAHMGSDPLVGIPILEINSEKTTTPASPQAIVQTDHPLPHNNSKWTKDH
nr:hypothetical protein [Tanacetum cinerariifolium]